MLKEVSNGLRWFGVKLIFEFRITGEPEKDTLDKNYTDRFNTYEESIILVKAKSFNDAFKTAEKKAAEREETFVNPYGQTVRCKFSEAIGCFDIIEELSTGTEVYSRLLRVTKDTGTDEFLDRFYPETIEHKDGTDLSFVLRRREFNAKIGGNRI